MNETTERFWDRIREGVFLGLLALLCLVLLVIQYRWTGELSRAEGVRLRASLSEGLQALGRAFDTELRESCMELLPAADDIDGKGREAAHASRLEAWKAAQHRPCFARMGVAVPESGGVNLLTMDLASGRLSANSWPAGWERLKERFESVRLGGPPTAPVADPTSAVLEFPVFSGSAPGGRRGREREWLLLELDMDYVQNVWMPELVRAQLNPGPEPLFDLEVRQAVATNTVIYASHPSIGSGEWRPDATSCCFAVELLHRRGHGEMGRDSPEAGRWLLMGRCRGGQLETVVARARWRNLGVAGLVNALILAAGVLLVRQTRQSRRVADSQMNFVAGVSHELRTPLAVIRSAAHNLLKGVVQDPARKAEYVQLIANQAEQLSRMIEQVLVFASLRRASGSAIPGPLARHSLKTILNRCGDALAAEMKASGCRVEVEIPDDLPPVNGDAGSLERVFQNLVGNAAKHGASGGWIGISARKIEVAGAAVIETRIADKGPGIPPGEQGRIFEPFFRGERARKHQIHGSGLGLSLVREIVEAHGGSVSVRSEEKYGTEFCVRLPAASPDSAS